LSGASQPNNVNIRKEKIMR